MTECARSELECAVHPSDDAAGCEIVRGLTNQDVLVFAPIDRVAVL
jgi:hypothetical protein